ncbi:hypothetical protein UCMB321_0991 [Pseudomonas batumici]|uniref:Uncharacterized protein n=1 Tax=Pseudomonas batumici TaxID=226910 RepID=A0A0C2F2G0_9PSED|nr:hypothetical protein UCMB321_0991 [Pseudomonas batumici]
MAYFRHDSLLSTARQLPERSAGVPAGIKKDCESTWGRLVAHSPENNGVQRIEEAKIKEIRNNNPAHSRSLS